MYATMATLFSFSHHSPLYGCSATYSGDAAIIPIYWLTTTLGACLAVWLEALIPSKTE